MNKYPIIFFLFFWANIHFLNAQMNLTLGDATALALAHNFDIKIAASNLQIAANNATKGNAGLLPTVNANGNVQHGLTHGNQFNQFNFQNTTSFGAGIDFSYTLFDGKARQYNYELLQIQLEQSDLQKRQAIENVLLQVCNAYLLAAAAQERQKAQINTLELSKERLLWAKTNNEFGNNNQLDVLNAQVDFNNDSLALVNLTFEYENQKLQLIALISDKWMGDNFDIQGHQWEYEPFELTTLLAHTFAKNSNRLINQNILNQNKKNAQIAQAAFAPKIDLQSGYNFNLNNPILYSPSTNSGQWTVSLGVSIPIFDGGQRKTQEQNAKLQFETQSFVLNKNKLELEQQVRTLYQNYQNQLLNIQIEQQNLQASERNLNFSQELLKYGQVTNVQFREAQLNLLQAQTNIIAAKFTAKQMEYQLLQLSGELIKILK
jgi:outer membrane protein TolC